MLEPSMDVVHWFVVEHPRAGSLRLTDQSLARAAREAGPQEGATVDGGLRRLGLEPLFAKA